MLVFGDHMESKYPVRGVVFEGIVVKQKTPMTCVVKRQIVSYIAKYERSLVKTAKYAVHIPENMKVEVGDLVLVGETRKISKTKNFIVMKILKKKVLKE
jgi:small subunit ribosomal protein S17